MGICSDRSVTYLKSLNLNTILHPQENIRPLDLIGEYRGARGIIGTLEQLLDNPPGPLPEVKSGTAANISGQRTSKLPIQFGLNILGNVIGALGGNLGFKAAYNGSRTIEFKFNTVERERANLIKIGDFLESAEVRWGHLILEKYLFGEGNLYVITEVAKADEIGVTAYRRDNSSIGLDVPTIQQMLGGSVSVDHDASSTNTLTYKGQNKLAFGFTAIELAAGEHSDDGEFSLVFRPVKVGAVALKAGEGGPQTKAVEFDGALSALPVVDPATLGEPGRAQ